MASMQGRFRPSHKPKPHMLASPLLAMIKKKILEAVPLVALTLGAFYAVIVLADGTVELKGQQFQSSLGLEHYLAIFSVAVNWILFLFLNRFYLPSLLLTCILGSLSIFWFTPLLQNYYWGGSLSFSETKIGIELAFEPFSFVVFILTLVINFDKVSSFFTTYVFVESEKESNEPNANMIGSYKKKFANKPVEELEEIIYNKGGYQAAAIRAAEELIIERTASSSR